MDLAACSCEEEDAWRRAHRPLGPKRRTILDPLARFTLAKPIDQPE